MNTVTSADGTTIAFEQTGSGTPVILIGGAFNDRTTVAGLAGVLAAHHTVTTYDRRGRGNSGTGTSLGTDTGTGLGADTGVGFVVDREIDDLAALIKHVGGSAQVFGHSSGAVLALEAVMRGLPITKLAIYEPPYVAEGTRPRPAADLVERLVNLIDRDRRDDAVTLFLTEAVGVPAEMVEGMRADQVWGWFTGLAHTLPYDAAACGPGNAIPTERLSAITVPTLVMSGTESPTWLPAAAEAVAATVPGAQYVTVEGQDHGVLNNPDTLLPALTPFFS